MIPFLLCVDNNKFYPKEEEVLYEMVEDDVGQMISALEESMDEMIANVT